MKEKIELKNWNFIFWVDEGNIIFQPHYECNVHEYFKEFSFDNYDMEKTLTHSEELSKLIEELNTYFDFHPVHRKFEFTSETLFPSEIKFDNTNKTRLKNGFIPVIVKFTFNRGETILPYKGEFR